jgi:hypothetical protein
MWTIIRIKIGTSVVAVVNMVMNYRVPLKMEMP